MLFTDSTRLHEERVSYVSLKHWHLQGCW